MIQTTALHPRLRTKLGSFTLQFSQAEITTTSLGLFHPKKWSDMGLGPYNWFLGPHSRWWMGITNEKTYTFHGRLQVGYPRNQSKFNLLTSRVRLEGNQTSKP